MSDGVMSSFGVAADEAREMERAFEAVGVDVTEGLADPDATLEKMLFRINSLGDARERTNDER